MSRSLNLIMLFEDLDKHMTIVKDDSNRLFLSEGGDLINLERLSEDEQYTYFKELVGNHKDQIITGCTESSRKCLEIIHRYKDELEVSRSHPNWKSKKKDKYI